MSERLALEDRERLETLFERASELPIEERVAFAKRECGHHERLRVELERLLAGLVAEDVLGGVRLGASPGPGTRIGAYELTEKLGEGGMGEVYAAIQLEPVRRRVALKFLKPGLGSVEALARFEAERHALARMSHPYVACVLDAGTTAAGLPFFVMEYVDGEPITAHCDRRRLSTRARVELFIGVCEGVQHAHQKGVVHRDIKPSNLLVAESGGRDFPKVIDFGVARATTGRLVERSLHTMLGQIVGTLDYMSPEQADPTSIDVDTRSDIYSLGVVLYQLVSGLLPFDHKSSDDVRLSDIQRAIREQVPPTPSARLRREGTAIGAARQRGTDARSLQRQLSGDLDWICIKTLEKDRERRYASASELADDLRRHLSHEPVRAGRPGLLYRACKYARRHRAGVSAGAAVSVVALAGVWGINDARLETADRAREVFSLSAVQTLDDLAVEADELWPADQDLLARYDDWIERARVLVAELPQHEARLLQLQTRGRVGAGSEWTFDSAEDRWWYAQLAKLVERLRAFAHPETGLLSAGVSAEHGWGVLRRRAYASEVVARTISSPAVAAAWADAVARVAANPDYGGLALTAQVGLVPLGPDPRSNFEEFADPQSGSVPARDESGELVRTEATGLVLVLLPGGEFQMGAQGDDANAPNYDPYHLETRFEGPVHSVALSAFLLSKYELTQGQWTRFVGHNPSRIQPEQLGGTYPVELVDWFDCDELCRRLGLSLPTEAQWEYGARGGTQTPWWACDDAEDVAAWANVWAPDNASQGHAPVGSYPPNAFGLHDVSGNVWEWCLDGFDAEFYARESHTDPVAEPVGTANRILRGGGYLGGAVGARVALRRMNSPDFAGGAIGLRPARALSPP